MDISIAEKTNLRSGGNWAALYKVGAISAFIYVAMMLAPLPPIVGGAAILDYVNAH